MVCCEHRTSSFKHSNCDTTTENEPHSKGCDIQWIPIIILHCGFTWVFTSSIFIVFDEIIMVSLFNHFYCSFSSRCFWFLFKNKNNEVMTYSSIHFSHWKSCVPHVACWHTSRNLHFFVVISNRHTWSNCSVLIRLDKGWHFYNFCVRNWIQRYNWMTYWFWCTHDCPSTTQDGWMCRRWQLLKKHTITLTSTPPNCQTHPSFFPISTPTKHALVLRP